MFAKNLKVALCAVALVGLCMAASVQADLVVYDHFDGGTLDSSKWGATETGGTGAVSLASSVVSFQANTASDYAAVYSVPGATGAPNHYGTYRFVIGTTFTGTKNLFGLNASNSNYVTVTNFDSPTEYKLRVLANGTWNHDKALTISTPPQAGDTYDLVYSATGVDLYINSVLAGQETALSPDLTNGRYRFATGWGVSGLSGFDAVGEMVVPEPGVLTLLGGALLGLLCYAWKKRR